MIATAVCLETEENKWNNNLNGIIIERMIHVKFSIETANCTVCLCTKYVWKNNNIILPITNACKKSWKKSYCDMSRCCRYLSLSVQMIDIQIKYPWPFQNTRTKLQKKNVFFCRLAAFKYIFYFWFRGCITKARSIHWKLKEKIFFFS